jgi:hypothetical protein
VKPFLYDIPRFPLKKFLGKVTITILFSSFQSVAYRKIHTEDGELSEYLREELN